MSKLYAIYEIIPAPGGDNERLIVIRDTKEFIEKVFKVLEETNINFDYYKIKELKWRK